MKIYHKVALLLAFTALLMLCRVPTIARANLGSNEPTNGTPEAISASAACGKWQIVKPTNLPEGYFGSIAVIQSNDIWAVGELRDGIDFSGMAAHWDGIKWRKVDVSNDVSNFSLYGVSALSTSDVWAVGAIDVKKMI